MAQHFGNWWEGGRAHTQISSMMDKKKIYIKNWGSTHEDLKLIKWKGKFTLILPKQTSNPIQSGEEENQSNIFITHLCYCPLWRKMESTRESKRYKNEAEATRAHWSSLMLINILVNQRNILCMCKISKLRWCSEFVRNTIWTYFSFFLYLSVSICKILASFQPIHCPSLACWGTRPSKTLHLYSCTHTPSSLPTSPV